jgi:hypothetical protein
MSDTAPRRVASDDWTVRAADGIEAVVSSVHDKAIVPVMRIARWIVYGVLAAILGVMVLVLVIIAGVRAFVIYVPPHKVWVADLAIGGTFVLAGLFLWSRRPAAP